MDAILYVTRCGIQWRNLPSEMFPAWNAVYYYFRKWKNDGTIYEMNAALNQLERQQNDRQAAPELALVDSQSVLLSPMIGNDRGLDGNKKVNGRKRHILTDTMGKIYDVQVHAANLHDSPQGTLLIQDTWLPTDRLKTVVADKTYRGTFAKAVIAAGFRFEVPGRENGTKGFVIEAKRWVVERSFAWLNFFRRCTKDYERTPESAALFVVLANLSMTLSNLELPAT